MQIFIKLVSAYHFEFLSFRIMKEPPKKKNQSSPSSSNALFGFSVIIVAVACCTYFYLNSGDKSEDSEPIDSRESQDDQGLPLFSAKELEKFDGTSKSTKAESLNHFQAKYFFIEDSRLYLAILGLVFDVTRGAKVLSSEQKVKQKL